MNDVINLVPGMMLLGGMILLICEGDLGMRLLRKIPAFHNWCERQRMKCPAMLDNEPDNWDEQEDELSEDYVYEE